MFHPNIYADGGICLDILQNRQVNKTLQLYFNKIYRAIWEDKKPSKTSKSLRERERELAKQSKIERVKSEVSKSKTGKTRKKWKKNKREKELRAK